MPAGTIQSFLEQLAFDIPWNAGILVNVEIISQNGTIHNPIYPAASSGTPEGGITSYSAAIQPVAQMVQACEDLKKKSLICSNSNTFLASTMAGVKENKERWGTMLMDPMIAAYSGNAGGDGLDGGGTCMVPFTQIANVENNEFHYPFLYLFRRIGRESIGAGYHRGGGSLEYALTPHRTDDIQILFWTHGMKMPNALGISGGLPSGANRIKLAKKSALWEKFRQGYYPVNIEDFHWEPVLPKSDSHMAPGDIVLYGTQGSGGYGDPIKREPERVLADVKSGFVTVDTARKFYGVVIDPKRLAIDFDATQKERQGIVEKRLKEGKFPMQWGRLVPPGREKEEDHGALEQAMDSKSSYGDPSGGKILLFVGNARKVVRLKDNTILWVCADCNHVYGTVKENPKLSAKMRVGYLNDLANFEAQTFGLENPEFFYREFYCPQCGVMWEGEVARAIDPILNSVEYDLEWLESL